MLKFDSYENIVLKVNDIVGEKGLNVLINNAGILKDRKDVFSDVNVEDMADTFLTNSIAPVMIIKVNRIAYFYVVAQWAGCVSKLFGMFYVLGLGFATTT